MYIVAAPMLADNLFLEGGGATHGAALRLVNVLGQGTVNLLGPPQNFEEIHCCWVSLCEAG